MALLALGFVASVTFVFSASWLLVFVALGFLPFCVLWFLGSIYFCADKEWHINWKDFQKELNQRIATICDKKCMTSNSSFLFFCFAVNCDLSGFGCFCDFSWLLSFLFVWPVLFLASCAFGCCGFLAVCCNYHADN